MIITACAMADLRYGEAILSAESNCFIGSQHDLVQQELGFNSTLEAYTSCGGGMTSAYAETYGQYFVLSAGSTVPGMSNSGHGDEASDDYTPIIDACNGHAAAEIQFKVDRPTLFTMNRMIEGTSVSLWADSDLIDSLDFAGDQIALRAGTYWASVETDQYGTPVWGEVEWWQDDDDKPADLDKDGKVDQKDVAILVSLMSKSPKDAAKLAQNANHPTGGTCTEGSKAPKSGDKIEVVKPADNYSKDKPEFEKKPAQESASKHEIVKPADNYSKDKPEFEKKPAQESASKPQLAKLSDDRSQEAKPFGTPLPRPKPGSFASDKVKGDLNNDKKVDMKDLFILLERL